MSSHEDTATAAQPRHHRHSGGISLTAGYTTLRLTDFVIDPLRGQLTARVGDARVPILALGYVTARASIRWGTLRLGPVGGSLTDVAASALNAAFALPAGTVPAGFKLSATRPCATGSSAGERRDEP